VRKKIFVILGVFLIVACLGMFFMLKNSDDLAPLKSMAQSDKAEYYKAADLTKMNAQSGTPVVAAHDISFRTIEFKSGDQEAIKNLVGRVCRKRHWILRHSDARVLYYSSATNQVFGISSLSVYWKLPNYNGGTEIILYETRSLSLWDEFVIRSAHGWRMPYSDPAKAQ
jgi:hypothetical protein